MYGNGGPCRIQAVDSAGQGIFMKKHICMRLSEDVIYVAGEMARATHRSRAGYIEYAIAEQARRDSQLAATPAMGDYADVQGITGHHTDS